MPEFETNLLKMIAASIYFQVAMTASKELYGKSYFALGVSEKTALDQLVLGSVGSNFQAITPELLKGQASQQVAGFQAPSQTSDRPNQRTG